MSLHGISIKHFSTEVYEWVYTYIHKITLWIYHFFLIWPQERLIVFHFAIIDFYGCCYFTNTNIKLTAIITPASVQWYLLLLSYYQQHLFGLTEGHIRTAGHCYKKLHLWGRPTTYSSVRPRELKLITWSKTLLFD